jgi:hypothetical protein
MFRNSARFIMIVYSDYAGSHEPTQWQHGRYIPKIVRRFPRALVLIGAASGALTTS